MRFERAAQLNPGPFGVESSELSGDLRQGTCRPLPEWRISLLYGRVHQMFFLRIFCNRASQKIVRKAFKDREIDL